MLSHASIDVSTTWNGRRYLYLLKKFYAVTTDVNQTIKM